MPSNSLRIATATILAVIIGPLASPMAYGQVRLYWTATDASSAGYIVRADVNGANPTNIVSGNANVKGPNGLEFGNGQLWWPDQQLGAVKRVNPDGSGVSSLTSANNPYDVFITAQQVFWTSQTGNYLDTMLTNGTGFQRILNSSAISNPFAVEVAGTNIYWSQVSGSGSIRRSDLNGSNIVTLIPNAYVYDFQVTSNYIYFADNNFPSAIKRANLNGSSVTNLVSNGAFFNGICVTEDAIYWSAFQDADGGGIRRANLNGSNPTNLYNAPAGTSVRGIVVLPDNSSPAQPKFSGITALPAGVVLTLQTVAGKTYHIESATLFTNWSETTNFVGAGSSASITNPITPGVSNLLFRAWTQ